MKQIFELKWPLLTIQRSGDPAARLYWIVFLFINLLSISASAQTPKITVTGTVTDSLGEKLIGVNIIAENKKGVGTNTDLNGKFVLDVETGTVLRVTYVGFRDQRVTVSANNKILNIVLKASGKLDEVVVVAYGTKQRKEAIVGSVTTVKPGDLKIPASNLTNAIAGQVAGVIGYQRSGQPGQDNSEFFVRGVTTFGYKRDPLILIDNVELTPSDLARLQVDDIASFSILKDASATALYGARGANGVIIVSTKEGKEGKAKISFRLENSSSESAKTLELADPITYMNLYNEAILTRDVTSDPRFTPNDIRNTQATVNKDPGSNPYVYPAVDWLGLLFKKRTTTQRANLSVSGGGGVARYYVAGSYNIDNGILREDDRNNNNSNVKFQNYQLRSNVNIDLTKKTELIVRLSGNFNEYNGPLSADGGFSTDLYNIAVHTSPVEFPAFFPPDEANRNAQHILFGNAGLPTTSGSTVIGYNNPYAALLRGHKNSSESRMSAQLELNQKLDFLTEGLTARGIFSTNRHSYFDSQMSYRPFYYSAQNYNRTTGEYSLNWLNSQPGDAREYLEYRAGEPNIDTYLYFQGSVNYDKTFGNHNINSTLIATAQQTLYSNKKDPKTDYTVATLQYALPYRNLGLAGRLTYSYRNKYFLETNFGYNGSERFSENHRFGFFPTIGGGWVVSNEAFWKGGITHVIDRLKFRASYGLVGNDAIGNQRFFYQPDVNLNGGGNYASFGTSGYTRSGVYINSYENRDITWETSKQTNIGLELTLFNSLNLTAEVYNNDREDILMTRAALPTTMGLEAIYQGKPDVSANIGTANSKGIDIHADFNRSLGRSLRLGLISNFTFTKNKYVNYEEPQWRESYRYTSGQPINRAWGYIAERLFVDDKEAANSPSQIFSANGKAPKGGDIKYRDLNNDGKIDGADQAFIGFPQSPEIVYGLGFTSGFKNFDLSAFFQGQARMTFFIDPRKVSPFVPSEEAWVWGNTQLMREFADNHWSEQNQDLYALYPRLGLNKADIENNLQTSTWWMRNGSLVRLKSLELGYTLPKRLAKSIRLNNCRIYMNGLNLLTWSPFKMWDPEQGGNGFAYPIQKVYNIGVNVSL
ncbi:SusC/RagA family TonB-linked outer membrane protein [Desertivirga arenae]|uniref:SusC/RagA family TonB-linked outer membrane protein n=1 Tax=Desertivirga arenae TaxID=2810309 RepID=UPI001A966D3E|nr:TonB-dependent receptor [Pedobacter sp. SYSU D00823]